VSIGATAPGAFAEYLALPAVNVWPADERIPLDTLAIFDPLGNAVHTALSFDLVGEDVLITGAGPVGCLAAAVVRHAGARHVVITDVNPTRLSIAEKMGVSLAVDVRTSGLAEAMAALGMQEGFDVGLEMSGSKDALRSMIAAMAHGGRIGLLGFLEGETPVELERVIFGGLTLKGIYGREMFETWYKMTAMVQGGLDVTPVITHHFPVAEYEEAFAIVRSGHSGKVILEWPAALGGEGRERRQSGGES
jgi:threonine 3-dehydrogenase